MRASTVENTQELDTRGFRNLMGVFPTGVTVITAQGEEGPSGMTANSVASLSLEPMLVMVGFDLKARTLAAVRKSGRFGVNFLCRGQGEESRRFASKLPEGEKFVGIPYELHLNVPILDGTAAWLVCDLEALYPGGDHVISVGRIMAMGQNPDAPEPLVFYRGRYASLTGEK